ncbi:GNAT family N-acetyltransferase [Lentibacillus saliphilus]|uniref:GNAT family N-acetyltransferase n=1 Tax=Lentibacillus saliphilus TaxID=2737028 RepID=UPI001C2F308D|nr:GNAT family N-acetyltransferase [Lentibacillus saliphilus]
MLKKRELHEVPMLYELMAHPDVFPYVRHKAYSCDEFYFITKQTIEAEEDGTLISRTILDECQQPIGTINLFDIQHKSGFLATWIGAPFFGKGYNQIAKEMFLTELFTELDIEMVFIKIRRTNVRSLKAMIKLPYATLVNNLYADVYEAINRIENVYDLFAISKDAYLAYLNFRELLPEHEGEEVS